MDINILKENITIFIGIFVSIAIMGIATLYDKYQNEGKISFNFSALKPSPDLNNKIKSFSIKGFNGFPKFKNKFNSYFRRKTPENKPDKIKIPFLKQKKSIQELIGNLKSKISSISSTLSGKGNNPGAGKLDISSKNAKASKSDKVNDFDDIVESKKDELDFDDDLLIEMSTASSFNDYNPTVSEPEESLSAGEVVSEIDASLNSDLMFDDSEFDVGFGEIDSESSEDDLSFNSDFEDINFEDDSDSLLASLKKDIVIRKEEKIDFMAEMRGENLDLKLLKSELENVLGELKRYKRYSNNN